ncbi:MAG: TrbG/VirB9 family P-type conjugative transfer protein [Helicobacteraceae bacterium]
MKKLLFLLAALRMFGLEQIQEEAPVQDPKDQPLIKDLDSIQNIFFKYQQPTHFQPIQNVAYKKNKAIYIRTRMAMNSVIFFPPGEQIKTFSIGDPSFTVEVLDAASEKDALSIRPGNLTYIDTNLVVVGTSGRIYNFYVWSTKFTHRFIPHFATYINLPGKSKLSALDDENKALKQKLSDLSAKQASAHSPFKSYINDLDFSYEIKNDKALNVAAVFRNADFTFVSVNTSYTPSFLTPQNDEIGFDKRGKIIKLDGNLPEFKIMFGAHSVSVRKMGAYKRHKAQLGDLIDLSELEFGYTMKVSFAKFWDKLTRPFSAKHYDVKRFTPKIIFNDNRFTYFKFDLSRGDKTLPQIYRVTDEKDTLVNSSVIGSYLRAEILSQRFTLRSGEKHLCVQRGEL